jgi:hypothetical protein
LLAVIFSAKKRRNAKEMAAAIISFPMAITNGAVIKIVLFGNQQFPLAQRLFIVTAISGNNNEKIQINYRIGSGIDFGYRNCSYHSGSNEKWHLR